MRREQKYRPNVEAQLQQGVDHDVKAKQRPAFGRLLPKGLVLQPAFHLESDLVRRGVLDRQLLDFVYEFVHVGIDSPKVNSVVDGLPIVVMFLFWVEWGFRFVY